jgi:hypothetical protein
MKKKIAKGFSKWSADIVKKGGWIWGEDMARLEGTIVQD